MFVLDSGRLSVVAKEERHLIQHTKNCFLWVLYALMAALHAAYKPVLHHVEEKLRSANGSVWRSGWRSVHYHHKHPWIQPHCSPAGMKPRLQCVVEPVSAGRGRSRRHRAWLPAERWASDLLTSVRSSSDVAFLSRLACISRKLCRYISYKVLLTLWWRQRQQMT